MALQTTGQISHTEIMAEFGVPAGQFQLSTDGGVLLQGVGDTKAPGDMIKESDFYGLSSEEMLDEYIEDSVAAKSLSNIKVDSMEDMLNELGITLKRDDNEAN